MRLTYREGGGGEVETLQAEHDHGVKAQGGEPGEEDVEDGERLAENGEMEIVVDLVEVSLQGNEDKRERVLLSESSPHDRLELAEVPAEGPALGEGGVDSPAGDAEPSQQLTHREGHQQQQAGGRQHPDNIQRVCYVGDVISQGQEIIAIREDFSLPKLFSHLVELTTLRLNNRNPLLTIIKTLTKKRMKLLSISGQET